MQNYKNRHILSLGLSALLVAITAVCAQITIPIFIPITLQVFAVFLAGYVLGAKWGAFSMIIYLVVGLIGLPVFANAKGGISVVFSPTFGYLFAFPFSAFAVGLISRLKLGEVKKIIVSIVFGIIVIYIFGVLWLLIWGEYIAHKHITLFTAISVGVFPFVIIDVFKGMLAYYIAKSIPRNILDKLQ